MDGKKCWLQSSREENEGSENEGGRNSGGEKWPDYGYISWVEATGFISLLDVRHKNIEPRNWKNEFSVFKGEEVYKSSGIFSLPGGRRGGGVEWDKERESFILDI